MSGIGSALSQDVVVAENMETFVVGDNGNVEEYIPEEKEYTDEELHKKDLEEFQKNGMVDDPAMASKRSIWVGDFESAIKFGKLALIQNGDSAEIKLILAESSLWSGKYNDAKSYFEEYLNTIKTADMRVLYEYGDTLMALGNVKDASFIYFKALDSPANEDSTAVTLQKREIKFSISSCYLAKKNTKKAMQWLNDSRLDGLSDERYHSQLGEIYLLMAEGENLPYYNGKIWLTIPNIEYIKKAIREFRSAYNVKRENGQFLMRLAECYWRLKDVDVRFQKKAIYLAKKGYSESKPELSAIQLSDYISTAAPNDEDKLRYCILILNRAYEKSEEKPLILYKKAIIYKKLGIERAYRRYLKRAIQNMEDKKWYNISILSEYLKVFPNFKLYPMVRKTVLLIPYDGLLLIHDFCKKLNITPSKNLSKTPSKNFHLQFKNWKFTISLKISGLSC